MMAATASTCRLQLSPTALKPNSASAARAALCPTRLHQRSGAAQLQRRPARARPAAPQVAVRAAMLPTAVPALAFAKTMLCGLAASWAHAAYQLVADALEELFQFSPHRLHLQYLHGMGEEGPLEGRRRYTLTHNDRTGELQLSIGRDWHHSQFSHWYKRMMRDEVLAEWRGASAATIVNAAADLDPSSSPAPGAGDCPPGSPGCPITACLACPPLARRALPSLHIYVHVSTALEFAMALPWRRRRRGAEGAMAVAAAKLRIPWPPAPARAREFIFQKDMPIVLAALAYAERRLVESMPLLAAAPVYLHFRSHLPELDRVVPWGRFGEPASWGPQMSTTTR